jgi:hypothetical protein
MSHPLENKIAARKAVTEQCYAEFIEICEMLGGVYLIGGPLEVCSEERGSLYREVMGRWRERERAAWNNA